MNEFEDSGKPGLKAPLTTVLGLPVFWWIMHSYATDVDPARFGRLFNKVMNVIAETLGPTGCVVLGLLTTGAALYWLFKVNQARVAWDKAERLELIRERQRIAQAKRDAERQEAA